MKNLSTRQIVVAGLLGALTVVLGLSPVGGFIPVPTPAGSVTTMHIPTILAGILEGPVVGALVGFIFGLFSFWRAQTQANPVARMLFTDPLIAFVPRILIGVVAYYAYALSSGSTSRNIASIGLGAVFGLTIHAGIVHAFPGLAATVGAAVVAVAAGVVAAYWAQRILRTEKSGPVIGALLGTATNTAGVLGLAVFRGYLTAPVAQGVAVLHGVPEMLVAAILVAAIYKGVTYHLPRFRKETQASKPAAKKVF